MNKKKNKKTKKKKKNKKKKKKNRIIYYTKVKLSIIKAKKKVVNYKLKLV